jgi:3-oxoacyl-[acyl-carrier-protein] synthase-3
LEGGGAGAVVRTVVRGVGHYLPERMVENAEFAATLDTSDEWIRSRSGIERRHFAAEGQGTADLAVRAARAALADAGLEAGDIDAVILATSTPDLTFPSAATMVQAELGMTRGFAYDVQAVCAGFVFALANADAMIRAGLARRVLVIGAETFSRLMDWTDRTTCVLFGDGAGAVVIEAAPGTGLPSDRGILAADLNSDGRYRAVLYVDGGVSTGSVGHLRMQGREVFRHAIEKLAATAHAALDKAGLGAADVDWIVPHQANLRIIAATAQRMQVPMERVVVTVQDHGNTSAASIPLALSVARARGQIREGDLVVAEAIGGGLAWGAVVLRW